MTSGPPILLQAAHRVESAERESSVERIRTSPGRTYSACWIRSDCGVALLGCRRASARRWPALNPTPTGFQDLPNYFGALLMQFPDFALFSSAYRTSTVRHLRLG